MNKRFGLTPLARHNERGAARLKFIIVLAVVALIGYMAFQYVPVAFKYSRYKTYMQDSVDKAAARGLGPEWVRSQLVASAGDHDVPPDAKILPNIQDGRITVTVNFTRPIYLLPVWTLNYNFDHTVKSTDLFTAK